MKNTMISVMFLALMMPSVTVAGDIRSELDYISVELERAQAQQTKNGPSDALSKRIEKLNKMAIFLKKKLASSSAPRAKKVTRKSAATKKSPEKLAQVATAVKTPAAKAPEVKVVEEKSEPKVVKTEKFKITSQRANQDSNLIGIQDPKPDIFQIFSKVCN